MALPLLNRDNDVVNRCLDEISKIDYGETFSFNFSTAGTFTYSCTIHSSLQGTVIVE